MHHDEPGRINICSPTSMIIKKINVLKILWLLWWLFYRFIFKLQLTYNKSMEKNLCSLNH